MIDTGARLTDRHGVRTHAVLLARLSTVLGVDATTGRVETWARERKVEPWHTGEARRFLEAQGFDVVSVAGDAAAGTSTATCRC